MTGPQILIILHARFKLILFIFITAMLGALVVCLSLSKNYKATTTLVLNYKSKNDSNNLSTYLDSKKEYIATQVALIQSDSIARQVVNELNLHDESSLTQENGDSETKDVRKNEGAQLLRHLDVEYRKGTNIVYVHFYSKESSLAAKVTNAFAKAFQENVQTHNAQTIKELTASFDAQLKVLHSDWQVAQNRLIGYEEACGASNTENVPELGLVFPERPQTPHRLVQKALQKQGRPTSAGSRNAGGLKALVPMVKTFVSKEPFIALNGSPYWRNQDGGFTFLQRNYSETDVFSKKCDQIAALTKDAQSALHIYEAAASRLTQSIWEEQMRFPDVIIQSTAVAPAFPNVLSLWLIGLFIASLGLLLGIACALLVEMLDRRIRSTTDLYKRLHTPVFEISISNKRKPSYFHNLSA